LWNGPGNYLRDLDLACRIMGGLATDDAEHAAARWAGTQSGGVLQRGPGHLGWTLSPATASMVADPVDISAHSKGKTRAYAAKC
jgi:hypothetical protein